MERSAIKVGYYERSLIVPTRNMATSDFDLTLEDKLKAINYAKEIANEELDYFKTNKNFSTMVHSKNQTNKKQKKPKLNSKMY